MAKLLIFGTKSTAIEIFEVAQYEIEKKFEKILFVTNNEHDIIPGYDAILEDDLKNLRNKDHVFFIISLSNHTLRQKIQNICNNFNFKATNVIHPKSIISKTSKIGVGNYIAAGSVLSSNCSVSNHCIINFNSTIGHDSYIDDHCIMNPGARVSGNVKIGKRVLIGTNSLIYQGVKISDDCLIDALTYIDRDIEKKMICSSKQLNIFKRVI